MHIALATKDDIPQLVILLGLLFGQEEEFSPNADVQARGLFQIMEGEEVGDILVIKDQDVILGMVNLLYIVSTALGEKVAMMEDMVILPDARGAGLGSRLLEGAIEHARAKGCKRITLLTDRINESAQRFYERHGFTLSAMVPMRLKL
ncbi:GCN5 family acetyltransferase [Methylovorus sp. MM2]|uniref:GNAT family N-acetyltransferase n=1 Tax=Methylovorus sp. MM2 TaxID=1848038 RepID=UPI0007E21E82|nr:GNAT family N-acetyltransferase [Methylovorus sp. MM2]OAM51592.1 GCN5 family acetyltransferase [Methylovorus sp. MM2]